MPDPQPFGLADELIYEWAKDQSGNLGSLVSAALTAGRVEGRKASDAEVEKLRADLVTMRDELLQAHTRLSPQSCGSRGCPLCFSVQAAMVIVEKFLPTPTVETEMVTS